MRPYRFTSETAFHNSIKPLTTSLAVTEARERRRKISAQPDKLKLHFTFIADIFIER
jgi:hypothetical protein